MEAIRAWEPRMLTSEQVEAYLAERKTAGASDVVLRRERRQLSTLCDSFQGLVVDRPGLQTWRSELLLKGLSSRTVEDHAVTANRFLRFLGLEGLCFPRGGAADLSGVRFGRLTAMALTGETTPDRSRIWRCRCDCGREIRAAANQLLAGRYTSCGCARKDRLKTSVGQVDGTSVRMVLSDTVRTDNTSGVRGVYRVKDKWGARIQYRKKVYYLGYYRRKEDAVCARRQAEEWVKSDAQKLWDLLQRQQAEDSVG